MLKGTEKQIKWATVIKEEVERIVEMYEEVNIEALKDEEDKLEEMKIIVKELKSLTESEDAVYYIENFEYILDLRNNEMWENEAYSNQMARLKEKMEGSQFAKSGRRGVVRVKKQYEI